MSALFLKRFLRSPLQVASIMPSSRTMIRRVAGKVDFSQPRVIAEFGPGEGCHTREFVRKMHPESTLLLFELDSELAAHLEKQFRRDRRVIVLNTDAARLAEELAARSLRHCDYVVSGIPFSILEPAKKRDLLRNTFDVLAPEPHAAFIIYQVTNELRERGHCDHFARAESEYCLQNLPPMFITKFWRTANGHHPSANGHGKGTNGHHHNGHRLNGRILNGVERH
jgi:phosphatidylethanolamine/phosphatidyl-N-methylethanolamine N-methyltransferase